MSTADTTRNRDSSILTALAQTDPSAWCFLPADDRDDVWCSLGFLTLWNVKTHSQQTTSGIVLESRRTIGQALKMQGIDAEDFFVFAMSVGHDHRAPTFLLRRDLPKVRVLISAVKDSTHVLGQLVRFQEDVDTTALQILMQEVSAAQRQLEVLSQREREVLHMVYEGRTNKAISIATHISEKTVEKHRARAMQKLGITCTAQLFRLVSKAWMLSDILRTDRGPLAVESDGASSSIEQCPPLACDEK
jgi:DNA-binding CsgD family transcriptional regulator